MVLPMWGVPGGGEDDLNNQCLWMASAWIRLQPGAEKVRCSVKPLNS